MTAPSLTLHFMQVFLSPQIIIGLMFLRKELLRNCKTRQQTDGSLTSHSLQPLWLTALWPSPTVQSCWMDICWPPTHRQLSAVFEVKQHPWLGAKSIFKEVVVVVVIQRRGRRNQRQRDALRAGIHTDASLMCDQAERQRTSVERGHRGPFLHLAPHFISLLHSERTHTKHTYNIRVPPLQREEGVLAEE